MSLLKVAKLGHPVLREIAKPVPVSEIAGSQIQHLIDNMIDTMREYEGIGLAAPQVHESLQIIVIEGLEFPEKSKQKPTPLTVLINPAVTWNSERLGDDWEGCLSIPDLRGIVPRYQEIRVQAHDREGKIQEFKASGLQARVIQHEYDHLIGKVFLERMRNLDSLCFLKEFGKFWKRHEED
ncbi:MAG: peptide deformylase [Terriglobia bacterium]